MNQHAFFDDFILMWLYKKGGTVSTNSIEQLFGNDNEDLQNVNNVISNRFRKTSYIYCGLMKYDENKSTLTITDKGELFIEYKYKGKRKFSHNVGKLRKKRK
ncbi:hypothetical protein [Campylobacter fetus]|uniref:Uncharacterized protein n=1 Tax=Campylobacter fetus subsp. testudinum TaxID=1507806 RepID=A0AAX0H9L6_CAMFE|nr:hypothetical protein [Campylobacter fetus]ALV64639.1 hypothetical protein CFTSP3_0670 [Campylobacter fetus subsp. testudinum Sp3]OCR90234.1 hypothetical protein CFT12S02225_07645 [Campylobacter fetus subsp. testudinum]OCR92542.1 hypothetical protein CFT12S02263_05185 [Campylobacter fetus subsp. testudinum]OCR93824.1 hypothetical protein CFT12S02842_07710 [Campylobacter fetus subsp. testudinum]OCS02679.1 hypothetical protein CFTCF782_07780 [Campylobacter fetus subsp. testudinum]